MNPTASRGASPKSLDQPEGDHREHEQAAHERRRHGPGVLAHPPEVGRRERESEAEHDDGERDRQPDREKRGIHAPEGTAQ